jgi:hypothetical protein
MRIWIAAGAAAAVALVVAGVLGVASAEGPGTPPVRTVSVEGVGVAPIATQAGAAEADGAYRQAMANAVSDGQGKAEFLASKTGAALGAVQSITENGGWIQCNGGEEGGFYEGAQPDFGSGGGPFPLGARGVAAPTGRAPAVHSTPRRKRRRSSSAPTARRAALSCQVHAQVGLAYQLG